MVINVMKFQLSLIRFLHIPAHVFMLIVGVFVLTSCVTVTNDNLVQHSWAYEAKTGLEGQAFIVNEEAARIEVECGNGGGSSIVITATPIAQMRTEDFSTLTFSIGGRNWTEAYKCSVASSRCGSFGFPSIELIQALRQGQYVNIRSDETSLAAFSLKGANAAIRPLSSCLVTDVF